MNIVMDTLRPLSKSDLYTAAEALREHADAREYEAQEAAKWLRGSYSPLEVEAASLMYEFLSEDEVEQIMLAVSTLREIAAKLDALGDARR